MRNPVNSNATILRICGDVRCNINPEYTALTTVFVREHNRRAKVIKKLNPNWNDEQLYYMISFNVIKGIRKLVNG